MDEPITMEMIPRVPTTPEEIIQRVSCALKNGQCSLKYIREKMLHRKGYKVSYVCKHCGFIDRSWYTNY